MDPKGLYNTLSQYYDRYQKPIMIAENGFGMHDNIEIKYCIILLGQLPTPKDLLLNMDSLYCQLDSWCFYLLILL
nr:hypothetical protein [Clostridioides difficile]